MLPSRTCLIGQKQLSPAAAVSLDRRNNLKKVIINRCQVSILFLQSINKYQFHVAYRSIAKDNYILTLNQASIQSAKKQ